MSKSLIPGYPNALVLHENGDVTFNGSTTFQNLDKMIGPWKSGSEYVTGQLVLENRRIYSINIDEVQTGVFANHEVHWDQLISVQSYDKIVTTENGGVIDNVGNFIITN